MKVFKGLHVGLNRKQGVVEFRTCLYLGLNLIQSIEAVELGASLGLFQLIIVYTNSEEKHGELVGCPSGKGSPPESRSFGFESHQHGSKQWFRVLTWPPNFQLGFGIGFGRYAPIHYLEGPKIMRKNITDSKWQDQLDEYNTIIQYKLHYLHCNTKLLTIVALGQYTLVQQIQKNTILLATNIFK